MSHTVETVQAVYQAFGRGDIPTILTHLAPNIHWEPWADHSAQRAGHPLFKSRVGLEEVPGFFALVGDCVQIHEFKVRDVFGSGHQVAGECFVDCTWLPTGRRFKDEELHLWTFGEDGQIVRFRHYVDTAKHLRAAGMFPD